MSHIFVPSSCSQSQGHTIETNHAPNALFAASTNHVTHLAGVLHAVAAIDRFALITVSPEGISLFSEQNHILNCLANVDASLFSAYEFVAPPASEELLFTVDIVLLSELFVAASSNAAPRPKAANGTRSDALLVDSVACYLKYDGEGYPFIVEFEDRLLIGLLEFSTFSIDLQNPYSRPLDLNGEQCGLVADSSKMLFELIILSDIFLYLLQDIQALGTEELYMFVSNLKDEDLLNFISKGGLGYLKLIFPNGKSCLQKLEVYSDSMLPTTSSVVSVLNILMFCRMFRAAKQSIKCKMFKDIEGIFSAQFLCKNVNCVGYPGAMITFNMLEKATMPAETTVEEIARLFDSGGCRYIRDYTVPPKQGKPALTSLTNPDSSNISYAFFKAPTEDKAANEDRDGESGYVANTGQIQLPQLFF